MISAAQRDIQARVERRRQQRTEVSLGVRIYKVGDSHPFPAAIVNMSPDGFLAEIPEGLFLPDMVEVDLPNAGRREAHVAWSFGEMAGCYFTTALSKADLSAARLKGNVPVIMDPDDMVESEGPSGANASESTRQSSLGRRLAVIGALCALPLLFVAGIARLLN